MISLKNNKAGRPIETTCRSTLLGYNYFTGRFEPCLPRCVRRRFNGTVEPDFVVASEAELIFWENNLHRESKKTTPLNTKFLSTSLPVVDRFSKLLHRQTRQTICNKMITKVPTTPERCRYTTLCHVFDSRCIRFRLRRRGVHPLAGGKVNRNSSLFVNSVSVHGS